MASKRPSAEPQPRRDVNVNVDGAGATTGKVDVAGWTMWGRGGLGPESSPEIVAHVRRQITKPGRTEGVKKAALRAKALRAIVEQACDA